jgi:hypothetical protein
MNVRTNGNNFSKMHLLKKRGSRWSHFTMCGLFAECTTRERGEFLRQLARNLSDKLGFTGYIARWGHPYYSNICSKCTSAAEKELREFRRLSRRHFTQKNFNATVAS